MLNKSNTYTKYNLMNNSWKFFSGFSINQLDIKLCYHKINRNNINKGNWNHIPGTISNRKKNHLTSQTAKVENNKK